MNIKLLNQEDGSIIIETADGSIHLKTVADEYSINDDLSIKDLLLNIWSNAKINNSNLILEISN